MQQRLAKLNNVVIMPKSVPAIILRWSSGLSLSCFFKENTGVPI